jgi:bifunctional oligoribonuclease and PAP phosphatase NrnA
MHNFSDFQKLLQTPKKVVITTHYKPDADAMGSSLGLARFLKKMGHNVQVITPSDYPDFLNWMVGNNAVIEYEKGKTDYQAKKLIADAELIFCLDFSAMSRIQDMEQPVAEAKALKIMIDHHTNPTGFADFDFHDEKAASTTELVYGLFEKLGQKALVDIEIGECIYAGIMTDTGSFRHPSTTARVHQIAAELIELGVNTNKVHRFIYDSYTEERLRFLGFMLAEKLIVLPEYHVAYFTVTKEELKRFNSQTGDTEGIVNYALSIKGMAMAAIIVERADAIKMSFRSIEEVAVNDIAATYFNGGGHRNAAGGKTTGIGLQATIDLFLSILPIYKDRFSNNFTAIAFA